MGEVIFHSDVKHRKPYFTAISWSHPAKMSLPLQRWLIERYTKPGDLILDPMAGSGTLLIACTMGRSVICVELEPKFVQMMQDNWTKIQVLGPELGAAMGMATILQGDARNLVGLLADHIIFSPPFGDAIGRSSSYYDNIDTKNKERIVEMAKWYGDMSRYSNTEGQIGNLPYGSIDSIVTSPPYSESQVPPHTAEGEVRRLEMARERGVSPDKVSILDYTKKQIDSCVFSPPYGDGYSIREGGQVNTEYVEKRKEALRKQGKDKLADSLKVEEYASHNPENIGNLKSASYLDAMKIVYQQCYAMLKPGGLIILVIKNFIRNKQIVRLDLDTQAIVEQAGFVFVERHFRKLTSASFWRIIYHQKYPDAPEIKTEDILVFRK